MPRYTYTGDQTVLYSPYLDVTDPDKPVTLLAEPGGTYEIRQAEGYDVINEHGQRIPQELPVPPDDGNWKPAEDKPAAKKKES